MAADPVKTVGFETGDGINANFYAYNLQIPGTITAQYVIEGNIVAKVGDGVAMGALYALTPASIGTAATAAGTLFINIVGQLTGGTVSLLTASTATPAPPGGFVSMYTQSLSATDSSPAAGTVWSTVPSW